MKILINVAIAVAGIFLAVGSVYAKSNGAAKNVALADRILSDTLMTRVDSMAREIPGGRIADRGYSHVSEKLSRLPFMEGHRFAM